MSGNTMLQKVEISPLTLRKVGIEPSSEEETAELLQAMRAQLELRVGVRIATGLSDAQLDAFEVFIDTGDQSGALEWLEENVPAYKAIVVEEFRGLLSRLAVRGVGALSEEMS